MPEVYFNDFGTALNGGINSSVTSILINSSASMPNPFISSTFRIRVDDELMLVTAINFMTNALTVVRGSESTTPANHANGAQVVHVLTAGALSTIVSQNVSVPAVGVAASLPGSYPSAGQSYWMTNSPYINMWNGSSFTQYYAPIVVAPPALASWTVVNGSIISSADTAAGLNITKIAGIGQSGLFRAVPTPPYKIAMRLRAVGSSNTPNTWAGAYWLESTSSPDRFTMAVVRTNGNFMMYNALSFATPGSYGSIYDPGGPTLGLNSSELNLVFEDDGTDRRISNSPDGINFVTLTGWPRSRTDHATYSFIGFGMHQDSSAPSDARLSITLVSWRVF